ncbi:uncharacterized membrane protein YcaP (DUF421 family) [Microbacterium halimionae]|uniref:Uncharacterized membrane protein YcaP (DUF421 family) n=1 Tax=Microbacterium halimionae TaxID=1526413 RepID=A0A7W3JQU0_9MICO|nr:YetF domain-containing protein [Microbacterium halimionae]MBA8817188.1 uncharacterized membrane protein YcaP (DUF421 family) [Microbacterium halimionae]NII94638.1 uncharacterized membrane protein YcaP (DUF421 family) [Microbacterium halimionae]
MWFESWSDLMRVVLLGTAGYVTLVGVLRLSGKRTLSQLNVFDFVVTVALGSILATLLLSADVSWAQGAVAFMLIAALQFVVAWASTKWPAVRRMITSTPSLLLRDGVILESALRRSRLTESELRQAIRAAGNGDLANIKAVVLETNGTLSVISAQNFGDGSAVKDVESEASM